MEFTGLRAGVASEGEHGITFGALEPANISVFPIVNGNTVTISSTASERTVSTVTISYGSALQVGPTTLLLRGEPAQAGERCLLALRSPTEAATSDLLKLLNRPPSPSTGNKFDSKTDKGSSELYFHYYGMLQHQQNMLQDYHRTGTYYAAILENRPDFEGKAIMDVGAGSGILSLFAAQAGARKVYAVEASNMALFARKLAGCNSSYGHVVEVVQGKVEEVDIPEKVDVLVSEPMGTLLVNERMLETYLYARDHFLKPGGKMYPQIGRVYVAPFSDEELHMEVGNKAAFWLQPSFYNVDLTALHQPAMESYFSQVVVDAFNPSVLAAPPATRVFDFATTTEAELHDITVPLDFTIARAPLAIHGLACWFDVAFCGSASPRVLTTAPGHPTTHWFQLRCLLQRPLFISAPGQKLTGTLRLVAHARQSYDILIQLQGPPAFPHGPPQVASGALDLKEPYYRQLTTWYQPPGAAAAAEAPHVPPVGGEVPAAEADLSGAQQTSSMG